MPLTDGDVLGGACGHDADFAGDHDHAVAGGGVFCGEGGVGVDAGDDVVRVAGLRDAAARVFPGAIVLDAGGRPSEMLMSEGPK